MSKIGISALVSCLLMTGSALATPTVFVDRRTGYYSGSGGEFTLTPNTELEVLRGQTGPFQSFCLEMTEYVSVGSTYDVRLNTEALQGGQNHGSPGPGGGDPLDARTAYLYTNFVAHTLTGYDYTPGAGRDASAGALQDAIWFFEDEINQTWSSGSLQDLFVTAARNAVDSGLWTGLGNVRVLNFYAAGHVGNPAYAAQDMLVTTVPVPGALLLASLGASLVGWLRRRRAW